MFDFIKKLFQRPRCDGYVCTVEHEGLDLNSEEISIARAFGMCPKEYEKSRDRAREHYPEYSDLQSESPKTAIITNEEKAACEREGISYQEFVIRRETRRLQAPLQIFPSGIMTKSRIHEQDVQGVVIDDGSHEWPMLKLPMGESDA